MMTRRKIWAHAAIVLCGTGGIFLLGGVWAMWWKSELFAQDFIVYYAGVSAAREGRISLLYDGVAFTQYQYDLLTRWFSVAPTLHPWLYPPHYLLLLLPFCLLPFALAFASFIAITSFAAVAAIAWRGSMAWARGFMLLLFPASCVGALTGQNTFLSATLLIGGMRLLETRPTLGAVALGTLSYKPTLGLMVPVALIAARAWRSLMIATLTAAFLVVSSIAIFGLDAWRLWLGEALRAQDPEWFKEVYLRGYSFYVAARLLGAANSIAMLAQTAAIVLAGASVAWVWRGPPGERRIALLLVATIVAAPHLQFYDMALLAAAVLLLFDAAGISLAELLLFALIWALPLLRPSFLPAGRIVVPIALLTFLAYAVWACRTRSLQPKPA